MGITTIWTLAEAQEMVGELKKAIRSIVSGTAKSYKIGSREYSALDLNELQAQLNYFGNIVESLSGKGRATRVSRVVRRDL